MIENLATDEGWLPPAGIVTWDDPDIAPARFAVPPADDGGSWTPIEVKPIQGGHLTVRLRGPHARHATMGMLLFLQATDTDARVAHVVTRRGIDAEWTGELALPPGRYRIRSGRFVAGVTLFEPSTREYGIRMPKALFDKDRILEIKPGETTTLELELPTK